MRDFFLMSAQYFASCLGGGNGREIHVKLEQPLLLLCRSHELRLDVPYQPFGGAKETTTGMGTAETLPFGAGYFQWLRGEKCVDKKVCNAVITDECDGLGEFSSVEIPMATPVRMVDFSHEVAESFDAVFLSRFSEGIESGGNGCEGPKAAVRVVGGSNA